MTPSVWPQTLSGANIWRPFLCETRQSRKTVQQLLQCKNLILNIIIAAPWHVYPRDVMAHCTVTTYSYIRTFFHFQASGPHYVYGLFIKWFIQASSTVPASPKNWTSPPQIQIWKSIFTGKKYFLATQLMSLHNCCRSSQLSCGDVSTDLGSYICQLTNDTT